MNWNTQLEKNALGFTGTQNGMSDEQHATISALVESLAPTEVHHGDCVGADAQFHDIAAALGVRTHAHPPLDPKKRAFKNADVIHPVKDYLKRNRDIVVASRVMIAAPKGYVEEFRGSGTWATIRQARLLGRPLFIVYPNGATETVGQAANAVCREERAAG